MLGQDPAFAVSRQIRFYERSELEQWLSIYYECSNPAHVLLAEQEGCLVGFACGFALSKHWAMLDNLWVLPDERNAGTGRALLEEFLVACDVKYVSTLVDLREHATSGWLLRQGFRLQKQYGWFDMHLNASEKS